MGLYRQQPLSRCSCHRSNPRPSAEWPPSGGRFITTRRARSRCRTSGFATAIAWDLGRALGCYGHVIELRRIRVGLFSVDSAVPLDRLPDDADLMARAILPLQAGLAEIPIVPIDRSGAAILRRGQKLLLRGAAPTQGRAYVECFGTPIAFGVVEDGYFVSTRVFNLRG